MAFRIHDSVVRGEIDNRVKGIVCGRIWVEGRAEPVTLELKGNAWPDLAGCLLTFTNPQRRSPHPHLDSLDHIQRGTIGDLTASRKVRVFDVPLEEALKMIRRKAKPPEHMANSLYLEWFSEANGRVVIESADYELTISAPEWRMTPEKEAHRAKQAAAVNSIHRLASPESSFMSRDVERSSRTSSSCFDARNARAGCGSQLQWGDSLQRQTWSGEWTPKIAQHSSIRSNTKRLPSGTRMFTGRSGRFSLTWPPSPPAC